MTNSFLFELMLALKYCKSFKQLEIKLFLQCNDKGTLEWIGKDVPAKEKISIMQGLFVADRFEEGKPPVGVVIKFSSIYNKEAYKFLVEKGHAPKLYECC
jgi:hypothetical protein